MSPKDITGMQWRKPKSTPKESNLEETCREYAKDRGWVSRKMNGLGFRSWPDRFFLPPKIRHKGHEDRRRFWVEFKRLGKTSTDEQKRMQKDLRARGEKVYEVDNKPEFIRIFRSHDS